MTGTADRRAWPETIIDAAASPADQPKDISMKLNSYEYATNADALIEGAQGLVRTNPAVATAMYAGASAYGVQALVAAVFAYEEPLEKLLNRAGLGDDEPEETPAPAGETTWTYVPFVDEDGDALGVDDEGRRIWWHFRHQDGKHAGWEPLYRRVPATETPVEAAPECTYLGCHEVAAGTFAGAAMCTPHVEVCESAKRGAAAWDRAMGS